MIGVLVFSFAMAAPSGWVSVPKAVCERAYGMSFDGRMVNPDGSVKEFVIPKCFKRIRK